MLFPNCTRNHAISLPILIVIVCRFFQERVSVTKSDKPNVLVRNFSNYCSILEKSLQSVKALNIVQYILSNIIVYNINMCISVLFRPGSLYIPVHLSKIRSLIPLIVSENNKFQTIHILFKNKIYKIMKYCIYVCNIYVIMNPNLSPNYSSSGSST